MPKHLARVSDILSQISGLHPSLITPRTLVVKHLGCDSLDLAELEHELCTEFDVDFRLGYTRDVSVQSILEQLDELTA